MTEKDLEIQDLRRENESLKARLAAADEAMSHIATEVCPNCETEVEMVWDVEMSGYKAFCPYCGKRLMLCDECQHPNGEYTDDCDYHTATDSCRFNRKAGKR